MVANPTHRTYTYVLTELETATGKLHRSFASKMLHLFNTNLPIWDSWLVPASNKGHFHFSDPFYGGIENKSPLCAAVVQYNNYVDAMNGYVSGVVAHDLTRGHIDCITLVSEFRSRIATIGPWPTNCIPVSRITNAKIVDFILWADRPGTIRSSFKSGVIAVLHRYGI